MALSSDEVLTTIDEWSPVILVAGLLFAAWQIIEARLLRKSTSRAYVMIYAEGDIKNRAINLVLSNLGASHAEKVRVTFDPELRAADPSIDHVEADAVWRQAAMAPGHQIRTLLDDGSLRPESGLPNVMSATVTWDSPATGEYGLKRTYWIDLNSIYDIRIREVKRRE